MKLNPITLAAMTTAALTLASCADQRMVPAPTEPAYTPAPTPPRSPVPPPRAQTWADLPATPGTWRWSMEGGQSVARFAGQLVLRCDLAARSVRIERLGNAASAPSAALTVRTQTQVRALNATAQSGMLAAALPARDPLLDAMAFSKGRFAVEAAGMPTLYVPSWTEVSRVVEDCR